MKSTSRARSFAFITLAYVVAIAVAAAVERALGPGSHLLTRVALADLAATITVFAFSVVANNSSVYDPYWSVAPIVIAPWLMTRPEAAGASSARQGLVVALVILWGLRLTYNWARGFHGLAHEDWRYDDLRKKTGKLYWLVSLTGIHAFPTVLVYLGCLALLPALVTSSRPLGPLDVIAAIVTLGATAIEAIADEQMRTFRARRASPAGIIDEGLWAWSRHPNYFGEVGFWVGLFLFAMAADPTAWWTAIGPVAMLFLFLVISIPMADKRSLARRPEYAEHMKRVSAFVPWFRR